MLDKFITMVATMKLSMRILPTTYYSLSLGIGQVISDISTHCVWIELDNNMKI